MITKENTINHYNLFKKYALNHFKKNNLNLSIKYIKLTAHIGYKYNFKYCDEELENLIHCISKTIYPKEIKFKPIKNRIVLYDSFAIDNRGLTQQYINALKTLNFEILYICSNKNIGRDIYNELINYKNAKILHLTDKNFEVNFFTAIDKIKTFRPSYILQHFAPWDILGFSIFNSISDAKRYLINLTDHAYWLGRNCTDFILEFRKYGIFISHNHRKIPFEKLLLQPYYPIQTNTKFLGFPQEFIVDKKIIFAGSAYYKIYGKKGLFLELVKKILDSNENVIFLFAGSGNKIPLEKFIKKNKLQSRFILLGNRSDINEVIKRIDIYVNTYPMIGGLMSQFAAVHHKPIIGYTDENLYSFNDTEDLLLINSKKLLVKTNINEFIYTINKLINDTNYCKNHANLTLDCIINPEQFSKTLLTNLTNPQIIQSNFLENSKINLNSIFELYYDMEVNFLKEHYTLIWNNIKYCILLDNIGLGIKCLYNKILEKFY